MALAGGVGVTLDAAPAGLTPEGWFFGEDQGRYLIACAEAAVDAVLDAARAAGVPAARVGSAGGAAVALGDARLPLAALREAHETGFARLMGERP
jgi:phosphoribosylformylglycinamidine synthase